MVLFAVFSLQTAIQAQTLSSITGTVIDSSGGVIPNANVTVTNDATNVAKTAVTNSAGSYTVTDLLPGIYTVKVEDPGFQTSVHNRIGIEVGHQATVDVTLQTGNTTQTVEVQENVIALDTTQPDLTYSDRK